jgi:nucleoside-diphosphate-sugar epimerase
LEGVSRLVQESVSTLYRDQGARWVDEDAPIDRYPMARGNLAAETNADRFSQAGGTGIAVRFGWLHGPGAAHSEQLFALARRHLGLVLGPPSSYVSSIHVADAAAAVAAALRAPGGDGRLTSLTGSLRVSNARFRIATGWAPRYPSAREGWIATATALKHRRIAA